MIPYINCLFWVVFIALDKILDSLIFMHEGTRHVLIYSGVWNDIFMIDTFVDTLCNVALKPVQ